MQIVSERKNVSAAGFTSTREFSMKAGAHLMSVLSGLYSNPAEAMVREYLTNMYDACLPLIRAGKMVRPPVLRLPSKLNPTLEFQDFGIGMDFDTVWTVYAEYGNSTKSDTNDEVGGFGLGSKTAFCYNNGSPWNIVATKDGVTNRFMAFVNEKGVPTLTHLSKETTHLPNGVTVSIPIRSVDSNAVVEAAMEYLPFFPMDIVVQNLEGGLPDKPSYVVAANDGSWGIVNRGKDKYRDRGLTVVMGNVPYKTTMFEVFGIGHWDTSKLTEGGRLMASNDVHIYVPIGSVDIVPSRDSLKMTDRTRKTINEFAAKMFLELPMVVEQMVNTAKTKWEKARLAWGIQDTVDLPADIAKKYMDMGMMGSLKVAVPNGVKVTKYAIENSDVCTPKATEDVTEFSFSPEMRKEVYTSTIVVNDTKKPIAGLCRDYIRKHFTNIGWNNRASRYGHTPCAVYAVTLPSSMSKEKFADTLEGFDNIFVASELEAEFVAPKKVRTNGGVYRWDGNGGFIANAIVDNTATEFMYLPLTSEGGRYKFAGDAYSMSRMAAQLGITFTTLYGIRNKNVADLDASWVNLETMVADKVRDLITTNLATIHAKLGAKVGPYTRFVAEVVPSSYTGASAIIASVKKKDSLQKSLPTLVARVVEDYAEIAPSIKDEIKALLASAPTVADTTEDDAKALVTGNPIIKMVYDLMEGNNRSAYYGYTEFRNALKKNL